MNGQSDIGDGAMGLMLVAKPSIVAVGYFSPEENTFSALFQKINMSV